MKEVQKTISPAKSNLPSANDVAEAYKTPEGRMAILRNDHDLWYGWAYHFLRIYDKESNLIPFEPKASQRRFLELYFENRREWKKPFMIIVNKNRQVGTSTLASMIILTELLCRENVNAKLISEVKGETLEDSSGGSILKKYREAIAHMPIDNPYLSGGGLGSLGFALKTTGSTLSMSSQYREVRGITLNIIHCSEIGFFQDFIGFTQPMMQSTHPVPGNIIIFESTAERAFDGFHKFYLAAENNENEFIHFFIPWYEDEHCDLTEWDAEDAAMFEPTLNDNVRRYGDEKELMTLHPEITLRQMKWRRWCIDNKCAGDLSAFRQQYPSDSREAFMSQGTAVFNIRELDWQRQHIQQPVKTGYMQGLSDVRDSRGENSWFIESLTGAIDILQEPEEFTEYVWGSDSAEGLPSGDFNVAVIAKRQPFEIVAKIRGTDFTKLDKVEFAKQLGYLCEYYNDAQGLPEVNNHGNATVAVLEERGYGSFILHERDVLPDSTSKRAGFLTTVSSKKYAIDRMKDALRIDFRVENGFPDSKHAILLRDEDIIQEFYHIIHDDTGKIKAAQKGVRREAGKNSEGAHDDLVIATSLCVLAHMGLTDPMTREQIMIKKLGRKHELTQHLDYVEVPNEFPYGEREVSPDAWRDY